MKIVSPFPLSDVRPPWPWIVAAVYLTVVLMILLFCHGDDIFSERSPPAIVPAVSR